ncbi:hypothetical protein QRD43_01875 [Pelomonas sp. APW6]|uniref:Uncharacterized protein n=1 Tax=Roseateles subflavus TaxID=3053353 RepID=A0ABT7LEK8_9BURK|nr:hypothetical protein [Pelomonas sp. APW6]MDL5030640.1 hypothetical protein [Pelomonas sp. APW6]
MPDLQRRLFLTVRDGAALATSLARDAGQPAGKAAAPASYRFCTPDEEAVIEAGERRYRDGPWAPGLPTPGCQLPLTPAQFFRTAWRGWQAWLAGRAQPGFAQRWTGLPGPLA